MGVITKENYVQNFKNLTAPSSVLEGPGHGHREQQGPDCSVQEPLQVQQHDRLQPPGEEALRLGQLQHGLL